MVSNKNKGITKQNNIHPLDKDIMYPKIVGANYYLSTNECNEMKLLQHSVLFPGHVRL